MAAPPLVLKFLQIGADGVKATVPLLVLDALPVDMVTGCDFGQLPCLQFGGAPQYTAQHQLTNDLVQVEGYAAAALHSGTYPVNPEVPQT